jgi:hypothetical protein
LGKFLGKTIEDSMGRPTGKLVGLTADIKDQVTEIQIAQPNGDIAPYPVDFVKLADGHPVLLQTWRVQAEDIRIEHNIIKRRKEALELLLKDGDIDQLEYDQLRTTYEDANKEIDQKRDTVLDTLQQVQEKVDQQIKYLQAALTSNKMLYTATEIDQETYHAVSDSIRAGLDTARKERKDLDSIRAYLQGIDSLETPTPTPSPAPVITVPDVVVIKMRDPVQT